MWNELPNDQKNKYKRLILAFASLTEAFAQKADENEIPSPIINSKFQETVFQRAFDATAEDIGNTSYDASVLYKNAGVTTKALVGIKTFGIGSGHQKIAQFKANLPEWSDKIDEMRSNAVGHTKAEIDTLNADLYMAMAKRIAELRNLRMSSSEANLRGFTVTNTDVLKSVYHVLMSSKKNAEPTIYVGETDYTKIDSDNIRVLGCTAQSNPANFDFSDGIHSYRFTSADSQLLMDFHNTDIIQEQWPVTYVADAYEVFEDIAKKVLGTENTQVLESYCWKLKVELFSGFNLFYGVGSKLSIKARKDRIKRLYDHYKDVIEINALKGILDDLKRFLMDSSSTREQKKSKALLRKNIRLRLENIGNAEFKEDILKVLFRPVGEMYIPISNAAKFHLAHPNFFAAGVGNLTKSGSKYKLTLPQEQRRFTLVFEPSGDEIEAFITQDAGKAIESWEHQNVLGEWILFKLFQLEKYKPLTQERLTELNINGIRLAKTSDGKVHLSFIWIDDEDPPKDYIE